MTKADRIRALYAKGKTRRQIAMAVYGEAGESELAYIRVVTGRRKDGHQGDVDHRYWDNGGRDVSARRRKHRYATDPTYRAKRRASAEAWKAAHRGRFLAYQKAYNDDARGRP